MGNLPGYCSKIFQAVIIIVLCILFFQFFGLSTFAKWERQDVQIVRRKEARKSLPAPALTICALAKDILGWKPQAPVGEGLDKCRGQGNMEDCVNMYTFSLDDVLNSSSKETFAKSKTIPGTKELINRSLWTSRMTDTTNGMCQTLIYDKHISKATYLTIRLNYNFTVFLHDPKFFVFKDTSIFIPFLKLDEIFRKEFTLIATRKKRMKRESKFDCNPDENYIFETCVRQKIVDSQGCVTPWDQRTTDTLPKCSKMSSMKAFESYYNQVFVSSEKELKELTGCLLPCTYTEYSLSDSFTIVSNESVFAIHYALTDLVTEEEVLLFPFDSLVSEFGGALGLFLGFSFLGALSMMQIWVRAILSVVKTNKHEIGPLSNKERQEP